MSIVVFSKKKKAPRASEGLPMATTQRADVRCIQAERTASNGGVKIAKSRQEL
jgi:hypothetical protein